MTEPMESLPLPDHPALAAWASTLNEAGYWALVIDAGWRYVFESDELRSTFQDLRRATSESTLIGSHVFGTGARQHFEAAIGDYLEAMVTELGPYRRLAGQDLALACNFTGVLLGTEGVKHPQPPRRPGLTNVSGIYSWRGPPDGGIGPSRNGLMTATTSSSASQAGARWVSGR